MLTQSFADAVVEAEKIITGAPHIQTEADLSPAWFYQAHTVGITAGTSTPDDVIDQVERRIRTFGREPGLDALEMAECVR